MRNAWDKTLIEVVDKHSKGKQTGKKTSSISLKRKYMAKPSACSPFQSLWVLMVKGPVTLSYQPRLGNY